MTANTLPMPLTARIEASPAEPRSRAGGLVLRVRIAFGAIVGCQVLVAAGAAAHLADAPRTWVLVVAAAGVVLSAAVGLWLLRRLVQPLRDAERALGAVSGGDLSVAVDPGRSGELRGLAEALIGTRERMFDLVSQVRVGMINVATNATQISRDNEALSRRTAAQAESLQQTAASMQQLTTAVRENAGTAQRAHTLARTAAAQAEEGGRIVGEVVDTMRSIRDSSHSIREVIGVIDAIAFQTNILALNAAVEAARAGEQGRGFAVVAAEVRRLAGRCAEAAREIKALIGASVEKVDSGGARVDAAGRAVTGIVDSVRQVAELIAQIDVSSGEQSSGIATMNEAVARMDGTTQDNASFVRNAGRTAEALQARAMKLSQAVAPFHLGAREHGTREDIIALVAAGCEFLRHHGRQALLDEVNRLDDGRFIHRDLYLMVLDEQAVFVAHGNNPARLGTGRSLKDVDGKEFTHDLVRVARTAGEGWVDYKWVHPVTSEVSTKTGYVRREADLAIYAAMYKE